MGTQSAFTYMNKHWGFYDQGAKLKSRGNFHLPRPMMTHPDISRIINSRTIQSRVRNRKKNPLTNWGAMVRLNPYAVTVRRQAILDQLARKNGSAKIDKKLLKEKEKWAWRRKYNFIRMATNSNVRITKEKYDKQLAGRKHRQGLGKRMMAIKLAKLKDLKAFKARMKDLELKALADPKFRPSLKQIQF